MSSVSPRTSPADLSRLRSAIAACERGEKVRDIQNLAPGGGLISRDGEAPPARTIRVATGFEALDRALDGGLHQGALNEVFVATAGSGAMEALLPVVARAGASKRLLCWIHPTCTPYPPALAQFGFDLTRWLVVRPQSEDDHQWAIDQTLRSGACDAVVAYLGDLHDRLLRRLQLAAEEGGTMALFFRPAATMTRPSPAAVRLFAEPLPAREPRRRRVRFDVLRCRGTSQTPSVFLEWSRDPLDESPTSWLADRTADARDARSRTPSLRAFGA